MTSDVAARFFQAVTEDLENQRLLLPTLPEVALKIRAAVDEGETTSAHIARVVATDTALSARLIRVANSPLLRATHPVDTLEAAVTRLGHRLVRDLVLSMAMEQMFQPTSEATDRRLRATWEHSRQVAAICHVLATRVPFLQPEQALLAGLVHNIGVLPLLTRADENPDLLQDEEQLDTVIRRLHPQVGAAILQAWDFPAELVRVAAEHERLERDSPRADLVDLVVVANLQTRVGTRHAHGEVNWRRVPAFEKLGLSAEVNVIELEGATIGEVESLLRD